MSDVRGPNYKWFGEEVIMFLSGERVLVKLSHYNFSNDTLDGVAFFTGHVLVKGLEASGRWTEGNPNPFLAPLVPVTGCKPFDQRESDGRPSAFVFLPKDATEEQITELAEYVRSLNPQRPTETPTVVHGGVAYTEDGKEYPGAADTNRDGTVSKKEAARWDKAHPEE